MTCDLCERRMYRRPSTLVANAGKYCSRACRNKAHPLIGPRPWMNMKGPRNPAWKGGVTFKRQKGNYGRVRYVRCPTAYLPMARSDGYVMEHRLVMARTLGRLLSRTEVVHHIDHNTLNNAPANLMLFSSNGEHKRFEATERR